MPEPRFDALTDQQIRYLRFVFRQYQSKEIAQQVGTSKKAVDRALDEARAKLGAATRFHAARLLADYEQRCGDSVPGDPIPIPPRLDSSISEAPVAVENGSDGEAARPILPLPVPTRGKAKNDLTLRERVLWLILLPITIFIAAGVFMGGMEALGRVIEAAGHLFHPHR